MVNEFEPLCEFATPKSLYTHYNFNLQTLRLINHLFLTLFRRGFFFAFCDRDEGASKSP